MDKSDMGNYPDEDYDEWADYGRSIGDWQRVIYQQNLKVGWWTEGEDVDSKVPEKLCLIHSEISEAMEGHRKDLMDDHLPYLKMIEVELGDAMIRIMDLGEALGLDLERAIVEKFHYNKSRADHKKENRALSGGKRY